MRYKKNKRKAQLSPKTAQTAGQKINVAQMVGNSAFCWGVFSEVN